MKFDGINWTVYNKLNSKLPDNNICCISLDKHGNKWIGFGEYYESTIEDHAGGLIKFNGIDWTIYNTFNSGLPDKNVVAIAIDEDDNKWIGTYNGLAIFDDKKWTIYNNQNNNQFYNFILGINIDKEGNKLIEMGKGFNETEENIEPVKRIIFQGQNWENFDSSISIISCNGNKAITLDHLGHRWLCQFMNGKIEPEMFVGNENDSVGNSIPKGVSYIYINDSENNKWFSSYDGLVKYDGKNWTHYNTSNSKLKNDFINKIAVDFQGNKWFGAFDKGGGGIWGDSIIKFDGKNWIKYNTSNFGSSEDFIYGIATDTLGNIWLGTRESGLVKYNNNWTIYNSSNSGLPDNWVSCLTIDSKGNKWIGTNGGGLAKFDETNWHVYNMLNSSLPENSITSLDIDPQGNKWIGTYKSGLVRFDGNKSTIYNTHNSGLPDSTINIIIIDTDGNKWIGTDKGLAKFDGTNWTIYNKSNSGIPNNKVIDIAIDKQGNKWICTISGYCDGGAYGIFLKFDGTNWTVFNEENSKLPCSCVEAVAIDKFGNKWLAPCKRGEIDVFNEDGVRMK